MPMIGPIIQRFFRNSFRWSESEAHSIGPLAGFPRGACILPRVSILFARIRLADVPARHRHEALRLELEQKAPFDEPAGWVIWQGNYACIWYWPAKLQTQIEAALGVKEGCFAFVPETALWPTLENGHYRWVESTDKSLVLVQYQHPQQGLYEKRYLTGITAEGASAWLGRHGAGGELVSNDPPIPSDVPALSALTGSALDSRGFSLESRVFPLLTLLLCFFVVVYGVAITRASIEADAAREHAQEVKQKVAGVLSLRTKANVLASDNAVLAEYLVPSQIDMAVELAQALDIQGGQLVRWAFRAGQLDVSWVPDENMPDTTDLITILEALPRFSQVQAQVRGDSVIDLSMQVKPVLSDAGDSTDD